jgi:hypothetical protein
VVADERHRERLVVGGLAALLLKVAVTVAAPVMPTVQEPLPEQSPPQPVKEKPEPEVAVSVTGVPAG